jgi:hypothetical protein
MCNINACNKVKCSKMFFRSKGVVSVNMNVTIYFAALSELNILNCLCWYDERLRFHNHIFFLCKQVVRFCLSFLDCIYVL